MFLDNFSNYLGSCIIMVIDDCIKLRIRDLKRKGYFVANEIMGEVLRWGEGKVSVRVIVDNINSKVLLFYTVNHKEDIKYIIPLIVKPANIGKGVVRYFECPISHALCRILYLCNGTFVSRKVLKSYLYESQRRSKQGRLMPRGCLSPDFIPYKRFGKRMYRGELTPYGKRIERYEKKVLRSKLALLATLVEFKSKIEARK